MVELLWGEQSRSHVLAEQFSFSKLQLQFEPLALYLLYLSPLLSEVSCGDVVLVTILYQESQTFSVCSRAAAAAAGVYFARITLDNAGLPGIP